MNYIEQIGNIVIDFTDLKKTESQIETIFNEIKTNASEININDFMLISQAIQKKQAEIEKTREDATTPVFAILKKQIETKENYDLFRSLKQGTVLFVKIERLKETSAITYIVKNNKKRVVNIELTDVKDRATKNFGTFKELFEYLQGRHGWSFKLLPNYDSNDRNLKNLNLFTQNVAENREFFKNWTSRKGLKFKLSYSNGDEVIR